jgi:hypothetical protein
MARATTSLPVPLSPSSNTGDRERLSLSMCRRIWQIGGDPPTRLWLDPTHMEPINLRYEFIVGGRTGILTAR